MPSIFLSHASADDADASAIEDWLIANSFTDLFVDHSSLVAGDKWRDALRNSAGACRVVLCLVTENWLTSSECFNEFRAAWYMGKRIIPLILLDDAKPLSEPAKMRYVEICAEYQGVDLNPLRTGDGSLNFNADVELSDLLSRGLRAAGALAEVGLDPMAFDIDRETHPTPFPGLAPFGDDDADAAIFYGRTREIATILETLRSMRALSETRPLFILGASGSGKSSLLNAGIIPRLRRERPAWLPLRSFRPGFDPLLNFAGAITRTLADFGQSVAEGTIRDRLASAWSDAPRDDAGALTQDGAAALQAALEAEGKLLRDAADLDAASILICVDQAEELIRGNAKSSDALAAYLQCAQASGASSWHLTFTIRTDSFSELQGHPRFLNLEARGYDLRAIPSFRFDNVIESPCKRYDINVNPALVEALLEHAESQVDAMPLLAFAMQRLWHQYAIEGTLTKAQYESTGGLPGLIEDAAERALHGIDPTADKTPLPELLPEQIEAIAAATFARSLAEINDQGAVVRRVAEWSSFTQQQQELLSHFDSWRLVVRKGAQDDGGTVEVTHESLFRTWARLVGWLEPEREKLETHRALAVAARAWLGHNRQPGYITHRDKRLMQARSLAGDANFSNRLKESELAYLAAAESMERANMRAKRNVQLAFSALLGVTGLLVIGWWQQDLFWTKFYEVAYVRKHVLSIEQERNLEKGQMFVECAVTDIKFPARCPKMVVLPAGSYTMGSPSVRQGRALPTQKITINSRFAVSVHEVTADQWNTCVTYGGCNSLFGEGNEPIRGVSWHDAQHYAAWLSAITGRNYRLLSEAEWEYAARGQSQKRYSWGDDVGSQNANCKNCPSKWGGKDTAAPVGSFAANKFGLHDMHGNVWEWVEDKWHNNYEGRPQDASVWEGGDPRRGVLRGGSFQVDSDRVESAYRGDYRIDNGGAGVGIRVARTLSSSE